MSEDENKQTVWIVARHNEVVAVAGSYEAGMEVLRIEEARRGGVWTIQACPVLTRAADWK